MKYLGSITDDHDLVTKKYVDDAVAGGGGGAVDSVNGQTGTVVLDADDVGAMPTIGGRLKGFSTRQTSANLSPDGSGGVITLLATSVMTTGRPGEGTIFHCYWDNISGWDHQLFVADDDSGNGRPFVAVRGQRSGTWTAWDKLLSEASVGDWITSKGTSGSWYYEKWASGKVEAIFKGSVSYGTMGASGQLYRSTNNPVAIPSGIFVTTPQRTEITVNNASTVVVCATAVASSTTNVNVQVWRSTNASSSIDCTIRCMYTP